LDLLKRKIRLINDLNLPANLKEKIYQIKQDPQNNFKLISYFPLSDKEKQIIAKDYGVVKFYSIFSDHVTESEWNKSKAQIIKRFQDELFHID
jgi:hypothetical protein